MTVTLVDKRPCAEPRNNSCDGEQTAAAARPQTPEVEMRHDPIERAVRSVPPRLYPEGEGSGSGDVHDSAADVSSVVLKAKKAAQSLWLLIHAQNCRMGGNRCPHKGCIEAKRILLHLKTCPAGSNGCGCPSNYNGCHQSRKLLNHYKKCRELRAKQAGMGRRTQDQQHVCLVCSLVARHAKNVLECSPRKHNTKKQVIASFTLPDRGPDPRPEPLHHRQPSAVTMPPPPPRFGTLPIPRNSNAYSDSSSDDGVVCASPPSGNQLMLFSEVAVAAAPPPASTSENPNLLGKSLDSSKSSFLTFAVSALQNLRKSSPTGEEPEPMKSPRRHRAESYDERAIKKNAMLNHETDPTLELDLKGEQMIASSGVEEVVAKGRARSSSLGMLASACVSQNGSVCDTIEEENAEFREEEAFPMDV